MNDRERAAVVQKLLAMQASLDQSLEWISTVAEAATLGEAHRLAFASHMLKEALEVWRDAMTDFMRKCLED